MRTLDQVLWLAVGQQHTGQHHTGQKHTGRQHAVLPDLELDDLRVASPKAIKQSIERAGCVLAAVVFATLSGLWIFEEWQATQGAPIALANSQHPMAAAAVPALAMVNPSSNDTDVGPTTSSADGSTTKARSPREWTFGGYGGVSYTYPSLVTIENDDRTNVTVSDFEWIGKPFKAPVYYGARIQRWGLARTGGMLDFIHAKAIAKPDDVAKLTGSHNGQALPPEAVIKDIFSKLEFSHGHNMLTFNGLVRLLPAWMRLRPYVGLGGGVSLPHTEIGFRADNVRTYEYQYAGLVGQALAGVEVQLGRASLFFEWKFTYAPYDVPLTHRSPGWLLVTDVAEQISDWVTGREPPGGRLRTQLTTHHAVAGLLIKNGNWVSAP